MFRGKHIAGRGPNEREQRVIELVAQGLKNKEVADEIGTTEHVIKNYLRTIYDKLGLWNRVELALWYEARRHEGLVLAQSHWSKAFPRKSLILRNQAFFICKLFWFAGFLIHKAGATPIQTDLPARHVEC
jgi:DNA-binding CsgD family transcriptional regulator